MRRMFRSSDTTTAGLDVGALAPMVDMMTLLLVFLLRTWSTEIAPPPPEPGFALGSTTAEAPRRAGVEIQVSPTAVYLESHRIAALDDGGDDSLHRPLYDALLRVRDKKRAEVFVDRRLPYGQVRRILHTIRSAGFTEVALVGESKGGL